MIKKIFFCILLINYNFCKAFDNANYILQKRLNIINNFSASFSQDIINKEGKIIQKSSGYLWLKRPNLFRLKTTFPDVSDIVSDGINLWFYNPLVEQVTITKLSDAIYNTPFLLIINNSFKIWKNYFVTKNNNTFYLKLKQKNENSKKFSITILNNGKIKNFSIIEEDGQVNVYKIKKQKNHKININKFKFIIPKGVTIDNQCLK
ncbi:outer membrane lipoprotein chaperone LolA [Candidatus Providencia siddallii]|uniref:Outer-membrane lipoprotein carrier protein n=1 Tax=Candidatus Providencia siddallii TaxID=1715285 RepID=A0ABM9NNZ8_9GAMM